MNKFRKTLLASTAAAILFAATPSMVQASGKSLEEITNEDYKKNKAAVKQELLDATTRITLEDFDNNYRALANGLVAGDEEGIKKAEDFLSTYSAKYLSSYLSKDNNGEGLLKTVRSLNLDKTSKKEIDKEIKKKRKAYLKELEDLKGFLITPAQKNYLEKAPALIQDLQDQIQEGKRQFSEHKKRAEKSLEDQKEEVKNLKLRLTEEQDKLNALKLEVQKGEQKAQAAQLNSQERIQNLEKEILESQKHFKELKATSEEAERNSEKTIQQLKQNLSQEQEKFRTLKAKEAEDEKKIQELEKKYADSEDLLEDQMQVIGDEQDKADEFEKELKKIKKKLLGNKEASKEDSLAKIEELKAAANGGDAGAPDMNLYMLKAGAYDNHVAKADHDALDNRLNQLQQNYDALEAAKNAMFDQDHVDAEVKAVQNRLDAANADLAKANTRVTELEKAVNDAAAKGGADAAAAEALERARNEVQNVKQLADDLQLALTEKENDLAKAKQNVNAYQQDILRLEALNNQRLGQLKQMEARALRAEDLAVNAAPAKPSESPFNDAIEALIPGNDDMALEARREANKFLGVLVGLANPANKAVAEDAAYKKAALEAFRALGRMQVEIADARLKEKANAQVANKDEGPVDNVMVGFADNGGDNGQGNQRPQHIGTGENLVDVVDAPKVRTGTASGKPVTFVNGVWTYDGSGKKVIGKALRGLVENK